MARVPALAVIGVLTGGIVAAVLIVAAVKDPTPGSLAHFRSMSAGSGAQAAYSVPVNERRAHADTCTGYNLELQEAAGIQRRIGHAAEAERLLAMRQNCSAANANTTRSAK